MDRLLQNKIAENRDREPDHGQNRQSIQDAVAVLRRDNQLQWELVEPFREIRKPASVGNKLQDAEQDILNRDRNNQRWRVQLLLPFLAGNVFQQLYNMADTWVVGNYVGDEAFSAVGTVTPVINMLIGTFMGFSSGAGVVISQYYSLDRKSVV